MNMLQRFAAALGASVGTGLVVIFALAVIDMYLAGHGRTSFVHAPAGAWLGNRSWGDVIFLASVPIAMIAAWFAAGRPG